ncbi:DUF4424 family protein [Geotalea sp. SG265]|uniref:DUF4424 family protein n=1 Tax=Geotalea sp. SG265 TaxID=2922867 RepID=UPI001FB01C58|nr:DUF4424 family protein [Geotalea sp. SG265]
MKKLMIAASILFMAISAYANDSAVEVSVGGLKLRKEHSVLMETERLFISKELVRVEYEFRNTSKIPVSSEVAFPLPAILYENPDYQGGRYFDDFKAWSDGKAIKLEKEVKAFVKKRDVTAELRKAGISIGEFGYFAPGGDNEITKLNPAVKKKLVSIGALKAPGNKDRDLDYWPEWEIRITYHWRQEFPPGAVVHIRHEYPPVPGYRPVQVPKLKREFKDTCLNDSAFKEAKNRISKKMQKEPGINNYFTASWVSYILTTANTWQTPIKDFEMSVKGEKDDLVSFCWDGVIEKTGEAEYRIRRTDFVPKKDLKVYFLNP